MLNDQCLIAYQDVWENWIEIVVWCGMVRKIEDVETNSNYIVGLLLFNFRFSMYNRINSVPYSIIIGCFLKELVVSCLIY